MADILFLFGKQFWSAFVYFGNLSNSLVSSSKAMPKGTKRKREDEDDPQPRRSQRERKRTSFDEDFEELFSPPKNPSPSKGPSESGPSTSSAGGAGPEPELPANTVTWASSPNKWRQPLPTNHCKRLYFLRK